MNRRGSPRPIALFGLGALCGAGLVAGLRRTALAWQREAEQRADVRSQIQQLEQRFAAAQRIGRIGTWELDLASDRLWWSDEVFRICGLEPGTIEPSISRFQSFVHPDDRRRLRSVVDLSMTARRTVAAEYRIVRPDGTVRMVERRGAAEYDAAGRPVRFIGTLRDITEQKRHEARRRESDARYRLLFERNPVPLLLLDVETLRFLAVNDAARRTYGYTEEEFLALTALDIRPAEDVDRMLRGGSADDGYLRMDGRWRHLRRDGSVMDIEIARHQFRLDGRSVQLVMAVDITDKVKVEKAWQQSRNELERFADRLQRAVETERTRIAQEIHDVLGQELTGLRMQVAVLESRARHEPGTVDALNALCAMIDHSVRTVRRIATDLRPGVLDEFGVVHAIEWALQDLAGRAGIEATFANRLQSRPTLGEERETHVFRVIQEALTNVARHSKAGRVAVELAGSDGAVEVRVSDNGVGFDVAAMRRGPSLGLLGMRERARMVGGTLHVRSAPGRGTRVVLRIPVQPGGPS